MNKADARAIQTVKGYVGEYRLSWRSDFLPVLKVKPDGRKDGTEYFDTAKDAELAAWREMNRIEQTVMVRGGDTCSSYRASVERTFFKEGRKATAS